MSKVWNIPGGIHPPEHKTQSNTAPIASIPLPSHIIVPLSQHIGAQAIASVNIGDRVLKGQCIADAQGMVSAPVHASTSGIVRDIDEHFIPHPSGLRAPCIVIEVDGKDEWTERSECLDFSSLDHFQLVDKIRDAGIAGMGGAGFPAAVKLNPRSDRKIHTLILNGTECEPYITADDVLMREYADEIVAGALLFSHILGGPERTIIGIEDNKPEAIEAMQRALRECKLVPAEINSAANTIEVVSFPTKYPSGGEKQLIQILTGKQVPSGGLPSHIGIVVQNVGTAQAAYRAVRYGEPLIKRITTVVGEALESQGNIEVLLGTPIQHILEQHGFQAEKSERLIIGGPMMGYTLEHTEVPVVKTTNCILVPSRAELPEPPPAQACIRCGMCAEACPASLLPQQLFWYAQAEDTEQLQAHNLFDCIECGACSYVCPSNIPLVQYYRASKGSIRQQEKAKQDSDRARQRFEFRQVRMEKAEAEKEAKRIARKAAAEKVKLKLAQTPTTKPEKQNSTAKNEATAAHDPQQLPKLERALSSAESRLERANKQLEVCRQEGDLSRVESLQARIKQAELNVSDAQAKLDAHTSAAAHTTQTNTSAASAQENRIKEKLVQSPAMKLTHSIDTLHKRIATAEEKLQQAQQEQSPTVSALQQGIEKLKAKLDHVQKELAQQELAQLDTEDKQVDEAKPEAAPTAALGAAELAIEKAKAKAAAQASMSEKEKAEMQIASLKKRLTKAKERLQQAEQENSEHVAAFRLGVEKLENKLQEAEANA
ncbi:MAG: electron transport complex protein RnfC [Lentisphaeria bacterium]